MTLDLAAARGTPSLCHICCPTNPMSNNRRGYVLDLATLWRLAEHWYDGRLDRGYVRREPTAAADSLQSVGLTGAFWSAAGHGAHHQ